MGRLLLRILYFSVLLGVHCEIQWLPCEFTDEHVTTNQDGHIETQLIHRQAMVQFGQKTDAPINPHAITFMVIASKLDLRRYLDGVEWDQMECELRRYSTEGFQIHWPSQEAQEYNRWFTITLKQNQDLFWVTGFLRQPSNQPPSGQQDFRKWPTIADTEKLITSVAMVIKTQSPTVKTKLRSQPKLYCQFSVDHRGANSTVEWHWQHRGERRKLFSHSSRTGKTEGSGVNLKALSSGDASYTIPFTKMSSEGTYVCSVVVNPLLGSMDVKLNIEEPPRVSLNVQDVLRLQEGAEHRVICEAENYFPLDVEMNWYEQDPAVAGQRVGAPLPKALQNTLLSSHKHNQDMTYSLSAFFYLEASLRASGRQFTCSVSHPSLRTPIKKSFILYVEEPAGWLYFIIFILLVVLAVVLLYLHQIMRRSSQKKPY